MTTTTKTESALRNKAKRMGYRLAKSRSQIHLNNLGEYMVVEVDRNMVVLGDRYDATLNDVAAWIEREDAR